MNLATATKPLAISSCMSMRCLTLELSGGAAVRLERTVRRHRSATCDGRWCHTKHAARTRDSEGLRATDEPADEMVQLQRTAPAKNRMDARTNTGAHVAKAN